MNVSCVEAALRVGVLLLIYRLHELPNNKRYTLDTLDLLLCAHQLPLQAPLLVLDVLFLEVDVPGPLAYRIQRYGFMPTHSSCRWSFLKVE